MDMKLYQNPIFHICVLLLYKKNVLGPFSTLNFNNKPNFKTFFCLFYRFRFWQWGRWVEVRVDDRLPTRGDRPAYMHCAQPDIFWAALLEKAYAKLYGGYAFLKYGSIGRALQDLTGAVVQSVPPSGPLLGGAVPRSTLLLAITGSVRNLNYSSEQTKVI